MPGWVLDCGHFRRQDPWETVSAPPPIRTAAIAAPPPRVYAVAVAGKWPRPENVEAIRRAVDAIPPRFLRAWIASGGRLEIVPGCDARIHPRSNVSTPALGWAEWNGVFCCVAGDHFDAGHTVIHEIAHCLDKLLQYPSRSDEWVQLWRRDLQAAGSVPTAARAREDSGEYFAESCSRLWSPTLYPTKAAADFILQLV